MRTSAGSQNGLYAWKSSDSVHWTFYQNEPVFKDRPFDTQNVAFWSDLENCYVLYYRNFRDSFRVVCKATSDDFIHWTDCGEIRFPEGEGPSGDAQFYANRIKPYYRAPELYVDFRPDTLIAASSNRRNSFRNVIFANGESRERNDDLEQPLPTRSLFGVATVGTSAKATTFSSRPGCERLTIGVTAIII